MIDRIASYFGYERKGDREYPRINNGIDAIARGGRWEAFYTEKDGLADMIIGIRKAYFEKFATLAPNDIDGRSALAMADYIAKDLDRQVRSIIETGHLRAAEAAHVDRIAAIER